jgi:threonine 3-dehydrogenase
VKAVTKTGPKAGAELTERDTPGLGPDEVLVRVRAAAICGTDKHIYNWDAWAESRIAIPRVFGHECCGDVVEIGSNVDSVAVGDFVSLETHFPCGNCRLCHTGLQHICSNLKILGVDTDGCFAEYVKAPALCAWKNPADMPVDVAAIQEPFGNAMYCVDRAGVAGKSVAILGDGPIAAFATGIAKAMGAVDVAVTGINDARLEIAEAMGADRVFDVRKRDAADALRDFSGGEGFDVVLEMAGVEATVQQGFAALRKGGTFVAFGIPPGGVTFDYTNAIVFKEATVLGVNGRLMFKTWYQTRALLSSGRVDVSPVLTGSYSLGEFDKAFEELNAPESTAGKLILKP